MTSYTQALGECAANSLSSFSWQTSGTAQFPCSSGKAYQKLDTGAKRFPRDTLRTKSLPSLCVGREQKSGPVCWAKGTDYAVFMLSQAGEMTNETPAHSASRVIRAPKASADILWAPICRRRPSCCPDAYPDAGASRSCVGLQPNPAWSGYKHS